MVKVLPTEGSSPATTERTLYEVEEENVVSRGGRKVDDDDNNILAAVERTNQQVDRPRVDSDPSNAHFVEDRRRSGTEQNYQIAQAEASGTPSRKQSLSPLHYSATEDETIAAMVAPSRGSGLHNHDGFTTFLSSSLPAEGISSKQTESVQRSVALPPSFEYFCGEKGVTEEESVPVGGFTLTRRGTRRVVRGSFRDGGHVEKILGNGKEVPFTVPESMFMGHPAWSKAAEFLGRHERRVQDVRAKKKEVTKLMKLVMDHDPASSGSPLPDVDKIFPVNRSDQLWRGVGYDHTLCHRSTPRKGGNWRGK